MELCINKAMWWGIIFSRQSTCKCVCSGTLMLKLFIILKWLIQELDFTFCLLLLQKGHFLFSQSWELLGW
jgi:hypothetical protein